ncbi:MAG: hypothetical protein JKX98_08255 [Alcanivoracaceae bacterium]|nr:hypothetical protein [Alcanivoracaceae bacterium]
MTVNNKLSYGGYGYNYSSCANDNSNFSTADYSPNTCGDDGLVNKQPFIVGKHSTTVYFIDG